MNREESVQHFLDLIKKSRRGKFKIYIGMIAGVGKSYRMLQEAHDLLDNGVDVQIGYVETHGRAGTEVLLEGLPVIPRRKIFYKAKELEEMDLEGIIRYPPRYCHCRRTGAYQCRGQPKRETLARRDGFAGRRYQCDFRCQHPAH